MKDPVSANGENFRCGMKTLSGEEFFRRIITTIPDSVCEQVNGGDEFARIPMTGLHGHCTNGKCEVSDERKTALSEAPLLSEDEAFNGIMCDVVSRQPQTVAAITLSGLLRQGNIDKHKLNLEKWIARKGLKKTGAAKAAGYNPPFAIPALRRNEVLMPVLKP